jgi:hypothetical protein
MQQKQISPFFLLFTFSLLIPVQVEAMAWLASQLPTVTPYVRKAAAQVTTPRIVDGAIMVGYFLHCKQNDPSKKKLTHEEVQWGKRFKTCISSPGSLLGLPRLGYDLVVGRTVKIESITRIEKDEKTGGEIQVQDIRIAKDEHGHPISDAGIVPPLYTKYLKHLPGGIAILPTLVIVRGHISTIFG